MSPKSVARLKAAEVRVGEEARLSAHVDLTAMLSGLILRLRWQILPLPPGSADIMKVPVNGEALRHLFWR